jgi:hypothetical protein
MQSDEDFQHGVREALQESERTLRALMEIAKEPPPDGARATLQPPANAP